MIKSASGHVKRALGFVRDAFWDRSTRCCRQGTAKSCRMSKENIASLDTILDHLEDTSVELWLKRCNLYQETKEALQSKEKLSDKDVERLLIICARDLNQDLRYTANALIIISTILEKVEAGKCSPASHYLLKSAVAILKIIEETVTQYLKVKSMCFETLLCYPNETLIEMACSNKDQVIKMLETNLHKRFDSEDNKVLPVHFLIKLLKILPMEQKEEFVKDGLPVWFNKVVPIIMSYCINLKLSTTYMKQLIVLLELLTESLVHIDYAENNNWKFLIDLIYNPAKYPAILQSLLERGANFWHRIWIVFIRLLKNQITKVGNSTRSPINALLPVVEQAFKMDATNRCRAFKCWNVLIDNFSFEENEAYVMKRLKLLIIPLKANNTKVAETVRAKFDTWWHLITQFQNKMDNQFDMLLPPFLHYCFRNNNSVVNGTTTAMIIKQQSLEALIEIVGHGECYCVSLPKLNTRLINTRHLVERWNDWLYFLKTAIINSADNDSELTMTQITCLLKGFVGIIGELPENNIRKDLFNELLTTIAQLFEDPEVKLPDAIVPALLKTLFGDEQNITPLMKTKDKLGPIYKILTMMLDPALNQFYTRKESSEILSNFKLITNVIMDPSLNSPKCTITWILKNMPINDITLMLWTALAESICESEYDLSEDTLCAVLVWPLKFINLFTLGKSAMAAYTWYILYDLVQPKLNTTIINQEISKILQTNSEQFSPSSTYFILLSSLGLIKQKLLKDQNTDCEKEAEVLQKSIAKLNEYQFIEKVFPLLVGTLVLLVNKVTESENASLAKIIVTAVNNLLKVTNKILKQQIFDESKLTMHIEKILKSIGKLLYLDQYRDLELIIVDELLECWEVFSNDPLMKKSILSVLKTMLSKSTSVMKSSIHEIPFSTKIKEIFAAVENEVGYLDTSAKATENKFSEEVNFTAPVSKATPIQKLKKKGASIVNTVVENGEEFVVVKSHWQFNPKKLTENQKEKFKRKREDIPALYQDLSQSQDEFKLNAWKTDSQDTTTTNSKSSSKSTNEDFSAILKTIPNSDVVPTIMETIMSDNNKNDNKNITVKTNEIMADNNSDQLEQSLPVKDQKLPRMALKDRVYKNVKILIEKTDQLKAKEPQGKDLNQTTNDILKTPPTKPTFCANIINSAPPNIAVERPLRIIKKPKKFADSEIFALKKRRRSNRSLDCEISNSAIQPTNLETKSKIQNETFSKLEESSIIRGLSSKSDSQGIKCIKEIENTQMIPNVDASNVDTVQQCDIRLTVDMKAIENSFEIQKQMTSTTQVVSTPEDSVDEEQQLTSVTQEPSTPKSTTKKKESDLPKSTVKNKRSRIEKQLLIDTVEGHPLLNGRSKTRATRNNILASSERRKSVIEKLNKTKSDPKHDKKVKTKEKRSSSTESVQTSFTVGDSQEKLSESIEDFPMSEDVIESSQDSTMTTISKSSKIVLKKVPTDRSNKTNKSVKDVRAADTQNLLDDCNNDIEALSNTPSTKQESREDIELPKNKTMIDENSAIDLTEVMDTEPLDDKEGSGDVIFIDDEKEPPILINAENTDVESNTLEIAEADTQPMETEGHISHIEINKEFYSIFTESENTSDVMSNHQISVISLTATDTQNDLIKNSGTTDILVTENAESSGACSPLKNDTQRKTDFLNNTIEISPIKTLSPDADKKSPSPETSAEYVVIKLTSPVQSNGEPFEKCDSPEIFTEDKVSPDKRLQSPPRAENTVNNTSPSSSLSLKKNRPQMRSNGRAAQMLVLCAPEKMQQECEQLTKSTPSTTPARRNLKILYNSENEINDTEENEDSENFLKFKRSLPTADCSPAGPILKRKLADIADEATISPANKRKRVSFHDPPVSTTVAIQKYIAPSGIRSPQSFTSKRQEKQMRAPTPLKSAKRLDTVFKLDSVLTKAVESFTGEITVVTDDTEMSSLDQTPAVEIVKTSELNDTDPICTDLLECNDPIENIASELSSSAMKSLLIKELEGNIETIADLAKMTELEVNRLCIKAPKVKVAKKVLSDYACKKAKAEAGINNDVPIQTSNVRVPEPLQSDAEVQTNDMLTNNSETQTICIPVTMACTQTDTLSICDTSAQTDETSTMDIITTCLADRPDFVEQLGNHLEESSVKQIAENLPLYAALDMIIKKMTATTSTSVLNRVLDRHSLLNTSTSIKDQSNNVLSCLQSYLCTRLDPKELILFCSQLLQKVHDQTS